MKASKARLLSEAKPRRKEKPQELATKKMQAVTEETCEPEPVTAADDFKIDYRAAVKGGGIVNSAFRRGNKGAISSDSGIRRGVET